MPDRPIAVKDAAPEAVADWDTTTRSRLLRARGYDSVTVNGNGKGAVRYCEGGCGTVLTGRQTRWCSNRACRARVERQAAAEARIGELSGPRPGHGPGRGKKIGNDPSFTPDERQDYRQLAEHIAALLSAGAVVQLTLDSMKARAMP